MLTDPNAEAIEAWNGVLFDKFLRFREIATVGLAGHGDVALRKSPPSRGARALDLGCGFGDSTLQMAKLVGPTGAAVGIDAAERFIALARSEAAEARLDNASFLVGDVQTASLPGPFDYVFSRFGVMFFASPVAALRNVRRAMREGGTICLVVWRRKLDNDWLHRAERVVERYVTAPTETDELTCGPGPFSMAGADTLTDILLHAGFSEVVLARNDAEIRIGDDLEHAVDMATTLGPAGEVLRLAGDRAEMIRPEIEAALRDAFSELSRPDGVWAPSSSWIATARS